MKMGILVTAVSVEVSCFTKGHRTPDHIQYIPVWLILTKSYLHTTFVAPFVAQAQTDNISTYCMPTPS